MLKMRYTKFFSEYTLLFVLFLLLLPLTVIEVKNAHDWGDDFAAYIGQANILLRGDYFYNTGFIQNIEKPDIPYVSAGWTLLLVPFIALFGDSILAISTYLSIYLVGIGLLLYFIARYYFSGTIAMVLSLLFVYNPLMLQFKQEMLSDIPFMFFYLLFLFLLHKIKSLSNISILGLMIVLMIAFFIRPMAITLLPVFVFCYRYQWKKVSVSILFLLFAYLSIKWTLHIGSQNNLVFYYQFLSFKTMTDMLDFELTQFVVYYKGGLQYKVWENLIAGLPILLFLNTFRKKIWQNKLWLTVFFYLCLIVLWQDKLQYFRYILPIIPLMLILIIDFINEVFFHFSINSKLLLLLLIFQLGLFLPEIIVHIKNTNNNTWGINSTSAKELFAFVKNNPNETFVFTKPRVLCMHQKINAMYPILFNSDHNKNKQAYMKYGASYFIASKKPGSETYNELYELQLNKEKNMLYPIWQNEDFIVYKWRN